MSAAAVAQNGSVTDQARAALEAVDLTPHIERKELLLKSLKDDEAALARAEVRYGELSAKLEKAAGVDPSEIAHILRTGGEMPQGVEEIQRERAMLQQGMNELRRDMNRVHEQLRPRSSELDTEMATAIRPISEELKRRADAAMQEIASIYASATVLRQLCGEIIAHRLASELDQVLTAPARSAFDVPALIAVPEDIQALAHTEAATFAKRVIRATIPFPSVGGVS